LEREAGEGTVFQSEIGEARHKVCKQCKEEERGITGGPGLFKVLRNLPGEKNLS
jgi:hypothetical protein